MSRGGIRGFKSDRLGQVLAVRRLTQAQLAALMGVSTGTVSKWRNGTQFPEYDTLEKMASALNVASDWFTRELNLKMSSPLFRSNASALKSARLMLEARLEWAEELCVDLLEHVDFPVLSLPEFKFENPDEISNEDIEAAADECRELWRLGRGPIHDLALATESAGIILIREETGIPQIEGLSGWSRSLHRPFILLSSDKDNAFRSRFDLAHEIGHCVLHRHTIISSDHERYKLMEKQAHSFAGALLMPAMEISREISLYPMLDDLLLLKKRWGASAAAILMRLKILGLIDDDHAKRLFKHRSARWGVRSEPGDQDRSPEQPRLLRRSIDLLRDEGIISLKDFPSYLGLSANDIEMLAGLPLGYFSQDSKVIPLATLRGKSLDSRSFEQHSFKGSSSKVVSFTRKSASIDRG